MVEKSTLVLRTLEQKCASELSARRNRSSPVPSCRDKITNSKRAKSFETQYKISLATVAAKSFLS